MGKASRRKKERKENPQVPHFEVHAGLAAAGGGVGPEMDQEKEKN